jgi:C4-dicarboxylate-binding protein DctP
MVRLSKTKAAVQGEENMQKRGTFPLRVLLCVFLFLFFSLGFAKAESPLPLMRISVENAPSHVHSIAVKRFAEDLAEKTRGRLRVEFYDSARLYRDAQVLSALAGDRVEMAVPGTWHFDRYEPNVGLFLLPAFYGRSKEAVHAVVDGAVGKRVASLIEENLPVVVPGRWLDLGYAHVYSSRPIRVREDMAGMKIRVAGGLGNALRIEALGGKALAIAWPDLPARLLQGDIEGVLTTHETIRSARLWESGLRHVFEDKQYFPQYIPLIRKSFWRRLSPDLQTLLRETWEAHVEEARREAGKAQEEARVILLNAGMVMHTPSEERIAAYRSFLKTKEREMMEAIGVHPDLYAETLEIFKTHSGNGTTDP